MAIRPFDFYVEMEKNDYTPVGEVKQLDTMELDIKVLENGVPKNLESSEIALYVRKKDGTILEQKDNISIVEASEGTIKVKVKNQATACVGMTLFELELKGDDGIATTGTFIFIVNERVVNGEVVESKDEIHALVEVEKYVKLAKEELQRFKELQTEMLRTNETINSNEEGRVSAEEKRVNAEKKRALAEEERETLFEQKEEERGTLFAQKELDRNNTFVQRERERNEKFEEAERNRAVAENERVIAEQARAEKFAEFESKISANTKELEGARTATTGEEFATLDERIDCEVDRLNKKIEVSMLQQEDKESHIVENTVEGMATDMVIKGRTLKNVIPKVNFLDTNATYNADSETSVILVREDMEVPVKANSKYTVLFKVNFSSLTLSKFYLQVNVLLNTGVQASIVYRIISNSNYSGEILKSVVTIPENSKSIKSIFLGGSEGSVDINSGGYCMIFEGEMSYIPNSYFEGFKSFGETEGNKISILSNGKNLFNHDELTNGEIVTFNNKRCFKYKDDATNFSLQVNGELGKQYTISIKMYREPSQVEKRLNIKFIYSDGTVRFYNLDSGNLVSYTSEVGKTLTKVTGAFNHSSNCYIDLECTQLEEGTKSTSFEPYQSDKKDILLPFQSGSKGIGNICDELVSNTKKFIERIGIKVYNGSESGWGMLNDDKLVSTIQFYLETSDYMQKYSNLICDKLPFVRHRINIDGVEGISKIGGNDTSIWVTIQRDKLTTKNVDGFKAWLQANPLTVYYELAEPVETSLDESIALKVYNEKTYVSFENDISGTSSFKAPVDTVLALNNLTDGIRNKTDKKEADEIDERASKSLTLSKHNFADTNDNIFPYIMDLELMILDMMALNSYTNKKYKIMERAGINMTSKQALERLIRQKKVTLEDALDRIVRYNDAGRITDAEALELTDLANEIL